MVLNKILNKDIRILFIFHVKLFLFTPLLTEPSHAGTLNLTDIRSTDGWPLLHLYSVDKLERQRSFINVTSEEQQIELSRIIHIVSNSTLRDGLEILQKCGCDIHELDRFNMNIIDKVVHEIEACGDINQSLARWKPVLTSLLAFEVDISDSSVKRIAKLTFDIAENCSKSDDQQRNIPDIMLVPLEKLTTPLAVRELMAQLGKKLSDLSEGHLIFDIVEAIIDLVSFDLTEENLRLFFDPIFCSLNRNRFNHLAFVTNDGLSNRISSLLKELYQRIRPAALNKAIFASKCIRIIGDSVYMYTLLHAFSAFGLDVFVHDLLSVGDVRSDVVSEFDNTPLMTVLNSIMTNDLWGTKLFSHYIRCADLLADHKQANGFGNTKGQTALSMAIQIIGKVGRYYKELDAYKYLTKLVTAPEAIAAVENKSVSLLCCENQLREELKEILSSPAAKCLDLTGCDEANRSPLHLAFRQHWCDVAEKILDVDPLLGRVVDNSGNTPMFYMLANLEPTEIKSMMKRYKSLWDFSHKNSAGETAVDYYISVKQKTSDKALIMYLSRKQTVQKIQSAVAKSEENTQTRKIKKQFKLPEAPVNAPPRLFPKETIYLRTLVEDLQVLQNVFQKVVSSYECTNSLYSGRNPAMFCAEFGLTKELKQLIDANSHVDLGLRGENGFTALHFAAYHGHFETVKYLVALPNIPLEKRDEDGNTALFHVVTKLPPQQSSQLVSDYRWDFSCANKTNLNVCEYYQQQTEKQDIDSNLEQLLATKCSFLSVRNLKSERSTASGNEELDQTRRKPLMRSMTSPFKCGTGQGFEISRHVSHVKQSSSTGAIYSIPAENRRLTLGIPGRNSPDYDRKRMRTLSEFPSIKSLSLHSDLSRMSRSPVRGRRQPARRPHSVGTFPLTASADFSPRNSHLIPGDSRVVWNI